MAVIARKNILAGALKRPWNSAGPPSSGTAGTLFGQADPGDIVLDTTNGVAFVNEGTKASPYWTPVDLNAPQLFGVHTDFRDGVEKPIANTDAQAFLAGSGLRVFGQGMAETDSGLVVQAAGEGGQGLGRLITTNEVAHTIAIGMAAGVMQPDQHQLLVIEAILTHVSAITLRSMFVGFVGEAADAMNPVVTGATTTATFSATGSEGDDLAGVFFDVGLTDADRLYGVHNKSNAAANQDLTADGDTSTNIAAAATEQKFRVEIAANGNMTVFVDQVQVYSQAIALDVDEECSPVLYVESTSTATKSLDVRRFAAYAYR